MNPTLAQLAHEAGITVNAESEKFARLIVRECMSNLYLNGYDDAMMQIKQHFGVEL